MFPIIEVSVFCKKIQLHSGWFVWIYTRNVKVGLFKTSLEVIECMLMNLLTFSEPGLARAACEVS
jgi:hypothetical protein